MAVDLKELRAEAGKVGFREGRDWLFSPEPLRLSRPEVAQLEKLGHPLARFQQVSDRIYRRSVKGTLPGWIADLLDAGKPSWLIDVQRSDALREVVPRVIRPDLLLTEEGFSLTELDAVPGGMGITGWLSQCYAAAGVEVLGGGDGMLEGFRTLLPEGGTVLVSEEAGEYQPEMEWMRSALNARGGGLESRVWFWARAMMAFPHDTTGAALDSLDLAGKRARGGGWGWAAAPWA